MIIIRISQISLESYPFCYLLKTSLSRTNYRHLLYLNYINTKRQTLSNT